MTNILSFSIVGLMAVLLFTLTDPFMYWMPSVTQMVALTVAAALVCVWAGFVIREGGGDERDVLLRSYAGRAAYLSGIAVLTLALIVQGVGHTIDPWVPVAIGAMILSKIVARMYADRYF